MNWQRLRVVALWTLLAGSLWQFGGAAFIHAKAVLAQTLLRDAWVRTLHGARQVQPWPWADTWPVARLRAPQHAQDLVVLAGASGRTLAFAPGHLLGSATLEQSGRTVIAGHRDTHFAFLREIQPGDELQLQDYRGITHHFRVNDTRIVDSLSTQLTLDGAKELVLVTCYPFDAIRAGGPLRFLVFAAPFEKRAQHNSPQFGYHRSPIRAAARKYSRF
ncbi:MAG: class GN sortase [Gammaproteobacteria bacterium]|nr:class GN sortase [Gammaproteobacteria bacterium]